MSASPTAHRTSAAATTAAGPVIHISNGTRLFSDPGAVHAGDRVTVINDDGTDHTYTSDTGAFDTGNIASGSSGTFVAPAASSTPYAVHCTYHSTMHGTLTVS